MKFVSLFSGVGGMDIGLEAAGLECVTQVEWDENCQAVLARHWPSVLRFGDVADVNGAMLPAADLVAFGSPCQDLSLAGRRAGFDGERSVLFFEATRIIREMKELGKGPTFVVWENVVGALTSAEGRDFGAVLDELADLGAVDICWRVLDARWFGVPQRRRRVFVVADLGGSRASSILPESPSVSWNPHTGTASRQGNPTGGGVGARSHVAALTSKGVGAVGADDNQAQAGHLIVPGQHAATLNSGGAGGGFRTEPGEHLVVAFGHKNGLSQQFSEDVAPTVKGATKGGIAVSISENQRGEIRADTEHTNQLNVSAGKPGQGYAAIATDQMIRRLTPVECERLMGWPDDHTRFRADGSVVADTVRYRMCGNGVAAPVAEWIGHRLLGVTRGA